MVKCLEEKQYKVLTKEEYDILLGIKPDKIVTSAGTASAVFSTPKTVCATGGTKPKTTFAFPGMSPVPPRLQLNNSQLYVTGEKMEIAFFPDRGSNPGRLRDRPTLYRVAIKAGLYRKAVQVYHIPIPGDILPLQIQIRP